MLKKHSKDRGGKGGEVKTHTRPRESKGKRKYGGIFFFLGGVFFVYITGVVCCSCHAKQSDNKITKRVLKTLKHSFFFLCLAIYLVTAIRTVFTTKNCLFFCVVSTIA